MVGGRDVGRSRDKLELSIERGTGRADSRTKKRRRQQKESIIRRERSKAPDRLVEKF